MPSTPLRIVLLSCLAIAACAGRGASSPPLVEVGNGVVLQPRAGLEWTSHDHAQALQWSDADRLCRQLSVGERTGWRLPEIGELQALYDERFDQPCGERRCHLDPAVRLGGPYVWSGTERGAGARIYLDFSAGTSYSPTVVPILVRQVLCVHDVSGASRAMKRGTSRRLPLHGARMRG